MQELDRRIAALPEEKRQLLERLLKERLGTRGTRIPHRDPGADVLPLSFAQQHLWLSHELAAGSPHCNMATAVRLKKITNIAGLQRGFTEIGRRHEALRTRFERGDNGPLQRVEPGPVTTLAISDLSDLAQDRAASEARLIVKAEAERRFDLLSEPPWRARLLCLPQEHVLVVVLHHIIADDWSPAIMLRELLAFVNGPAAVAAAIPQPVGARFGDFILWERSRASAGAFDAHIDYWRERLRGPLSPLWFAPHSGLPAALPYRAERRRRTLPQSLVHRLDAFSRSRGVTLFTTLLAAFRILLYRHTGQSDILVGSPVTTRTLPELEALVGCFINTVVLRTRISPNMRASELLDCVRSSVGDAWAHSEAPFDLVLEAIRPDRDSRSLPVFQAMFVLQDPKQVRRELPAEVLEYSEVPNGASALDLTLLVCPEGGALSATLEYRPELFDAETIERMLARLEDLLDAMAEHPEKRIFELPMLTPGERRQLLQDWSGEASQNAEPVPVPILDRIEQQVHQAPDAIAVLWQNGELPYSELKRRSNQLAHRLRRAGIRRESRVGLCMDRGPELVVAILGIWKAGGAYVPIDPDHPPGRQAWIANDAAISAIVTRGAYAAAMENLRLPLIVLEREWRELDNESGDGLIGIAPAPDQLGYVIYTSGSTGRPKGVLIPHKGLWRHAPALRDLIGLRPTDRFLLMTPPTFDASVAVIFPTLISGATLCTLGEPDWTGRGVMEAIERYKIAAIDLPASLWRRAVEDMVEEDLRVPESLKTLVVGGESPSVEALRNWEQRLSGPARFVNAYGPTEATITATAWTRDYDPGAKVPGAGTTTPLVPIGRPVAGKRVYILDRWLQPSPPGVAGDVYIGDAGLARGYASAPDMTAERFVPDPFGSESGGRLYRTGDIARFTAGGQIEFLGRADGQIKVNGVRIESAEIEAVLREHPSVKDAAVTAQGTGTGPEQLIAHVVLDRGAVPAARELRQWLQDRLPTSMIPAAFVACDELPLTEHGKVDRSALHAPERAPEAPYVAPRTEAEQALARIWGEILRSERVGIHDNFFDLGGDSILSQRVVSRARAVGLEISSTDIFRNQTIAELAAAAHEVNPCKGEEPPVVGPVPLSPIQRWFFEMGVPNPAHWNLWAVFELDADVSVLLLEEAASALLDRHDALRMRFRREGEEWRQWCEPPGTPVRVERINLTHLSERDQDAAIKQKISVLQRSLNLSDGPLIRFAFFDVGRCRRARLLIVVHHLVFDAVSWSVLLEDLMAAYRQRRGEPVRLAPTGSSLRSWTDRMEEYVRSDRLETDLRYWLNQPRSTTTLEPNFVRGSNDERSVRVVQIRIEAAQTAALREIRPASHAEMHELLLTAVIQALSRMARPGELSVTMEHHGRRADLLGGIDLSRTIGWFTAWYPALFPIQPGRRGAQLLRDVKERLRQASSHGFSFQVLWDRLRHLGADIVFNYLPTFDSSEGVFEWAAAEVAASRDPNGIRSHLLEIDIAAAGGELLVRFTYSANRHTAESMEKLAADFAAALEELVESVKSAGEDDCSPSDFPLVDLEPAQLASIMSQVGRSKGAAQ
jgi:amino acid adenylation domain-containing protein/non-ribosomal peptide synthase protein (TIGR01720 family)